MGGILVNTTGTDDSTVTMRMNGDVDATTAGHLRSALVDVIMRQKPHRIVIDLDGVTALDSGVIGTLRAAHATAQDVHLTLDFHTAGSPMRDQLDRDGIRDSRIIA
jgi:anti-anti-sigma factor